MAETRNGKIQIFSFAGSQVRAVMIDDEPFFVGKDVAKILGYKDLNRAVNQHVDREDRKSLSRKAWGDLVPLWEKANDWANKVMVSEAGLYKLIFKSHAPNAEKFTDWIAEEVLPSIRKHGAYFTPTTIDDLIADPDMFIELLNQLKQERTKKN